MATQLGSTTQKARKTHRCDSCCGTIQIGQFYSRSRMVDGGDAWVFKAHIACRKAGDILWDNGIRKEDEFIVNVSDMDREDREMVFAKDPEIYQAVWPDAPVPGTPKLASTEGTDMQEQNFVLITQMGKNPVLKKPMQATSEAVLRLLDECLQRGGSEEEIRTVCIVDEYGEFDTYSERHFRFMLGGPTT